MQQGEKKGVGRKILWAVLALLLAGVVFACGWFGSYASLDARDRSLLWAIRTAKQNFYEPIDEDEFYGKLFSVFELDPYSCYYTAAEYSSVAGEREGNNRGTGFAMSADEAETLPHIMYVEQNSPAQRAGMKQGMYITAFGDNASTPLTGNARDLVAYANTASALFVKCGFERDGSDGRVIEVVAEEYSAAYCSYADSETSFGFRGEARSVPRLTETNEPISFLDEKTAYIRIDEFNGNAASEFVQLLSKMKERGRENLILDLRTNGGGYMDIFLEIASHVTKTAKNRPVFATAKMRSGEEISYSAAAGDYDAYFTPQSRVKILANEYTASASECLIGAMHDYGTVEYGDIYLRKNEAGVAKSYGKGIMQSHFGDSQGNVLKITVAEIFWPQGRSIHGVGVTEADGAHAVASPLIWGLDDEMLEAAAASLHTD